VNLAIAKFVTIPFDLLAVEAVHWTVLWMIIVASLRELGATVAAPLFGVDGCTRLENGPQVAKGDDLVFDEVIFGFNCVFQFCVQGIVKQAKMIFRLSIRLIFER